MDEQKLDQRSGTWIFGPDWPGQRCGAITRAGSPCRNPAVTGRHRCRKHGGKAGAPTGERNGNFRTGEYTHERLARDRADVAELRALIAAGRKLGVFV
jgi:hypothetical protein